jgi:glutathione S-transferase
MSLEDTPADPAAIAARSAAARFYEQMNTRLESRSFLAGEYSYADIAFFMAQLFGERKGAVMTGTTPQLLDWRARTLERPAVRQVAGAMAAWIASQGRPVPAYLTQALAPRA